jgi:hypothetical protein
VCRRILRVLQMPDRVPVLFGDLGQYVNRPLGQLLKTGPRTVPRNGRPDGGRAHVCQRGGGRAAEGRMPTKSERPRTGMALTQSATGTSRRWVGSDSVLHKQHHATILCGAATEIRPAALAGAALFLVPTCREPRPGRHR